MTKRQYKEYVDKNAPRSRTGFNATRAFISGGLICCIGECILLLYKHFGFDEEKAGLLVSVTLIFIGALLTALHLYERLAKHCGAGTLVPITGFANSITASAMEFKCEGLVCGTASKMFAIAGPVLVFGLTASTICGVVLWIIRCVSG